MNLWYAMVSAFFLVFWTACSSSEFASSSGANKGKQNAKEGDDGDADGEAETGDDDSADADDVDAGDSDGDTDGPGDETDQSTANPDGTITERFTGSLVKLEGGSDIIFAVDTSGSMNDEKTMLEQNMSAFLNKFSQQNAKLDYQVFLIGSNFQFPQNLGDKFFQVQRKVSSTDALKVLTEFFNGQLAAPKPVRENTKKQIIVVTDDNARGTTYPIFKDFINSKPSLKGKTSLNGFVILPNSALSNWCTKAREGTDYVSLANDPDTKGTIYDLCTPDWAVLLKGLAEKILQDVPKERFPLNSEPVDANDIKVTVGGTKVEQPAWSYDQAANTIVFTKEAAPENGAKVEATFKPQ